jgi:hypothetical protein
MDVTLMFVVNVQNNPQLIDVYVIGEIDSLLSVKQHSVQNIHWLTTLIPNHEIHLIDYHYRLIA